MSVMTAFERHMMPSTEIDKFNLGGRELLQDKFDRFIAQNRTKVHGTVAWLFTRWVNDHNA